MPYYQTRSAVLFIIFNRPDTTREVFDAIKAAKPSRLYIAADGPRTSRANEEQLCAGARNIISLIDWDCETKTLFREANLGCKEAVSSAVSWFFDHEEEGIVLEDDCLPDNSFFMFCDTMLQLYRYDTRIRHICGCNLQSGSVWGSASYYFSNLTNVWGWAGWRRIWADYDKELHGFETADVELQLANIFTDPYIVKGWLNIFRMMKTKQIDTWDYQLAFINFFNNGLSVIPNKNLISNIGFRPDATHTVDANNKFDRLPVEPIGVITHPQYKLPQKQADNALLQQEFDVKRQRKKYNSPRQRLKRLFKGNK